MLAEYCSRANLMNCNCGVDIFHQVVRLYSDKFYRLFAAEHRKRQVASITNRFTMALVHGRVVRAYLWRGLLCPALSRLRLWSAGVFCHGAIKWCAGQTFRVTGCLGPYRSVSKLILVQVISSDIYIKFCFLIKELLYKLCLFALNATFKPDDPDIKWMTDGDHVYQSLNSPISSIAEVLAGGKR